MRTEEGLSDYGYYGSTAEYPEHKLPIIETCLCNSRGTLMTEYDDTPGYRETTYLLKCKKCDIEAGGGSEIQDTIKKWNDICHKQKAIPVELRVILQLAKELRKEIKEAFDDVITLQMPEECGEKAVKKLRDKMNAKDEFGKRKYSG